MPPPPIFTAEASRQRVRRARLRRRLLGLVFGVLLLLLAGALYLLLGPKPPPPPTVIPVTPAQAAQAEQNVSAFRQALTAPETLPPAPASIKSVTRQSGDVQHRQRPDGTTVYTLQVSQADLNAYLSSNKRLRKSLQAKGIHAVSIELLSPANVVIHANATLKGVTDNALVAATLIPDPKTGVRLDITDARFGRLPPPVVRAAAVRIAGQLLGHSHKPLPMRLRTITVKGTALVLTGVRAAAT